MTIQSHDKATASVLAEIKALFGPPPVLSSESASAYDAMLEQLVQCLRPADFMEQTLIKHLADSNWEIARYTRHKTLMIERKFRQLAEAQKQRSKALAERREALAQERTGKEKKPESALDHMFELAEVVDDLVPDVDAILEQRTQELAHNRALEVGIVFHASLDQLLNFAITRRNIVLQQLEWYRDGLGQDLRRISDQVIGDNCGAEPSIEVAPPLVPPASECQ